MAKQRLDLLLVERKLCDSRQQAQRVIRAGEVRVKQQIVDKPGTLIPTDAAIEVQAKPPFVSRGGEKLAKAIAHFQISIQDRVCLDGGISTGGFTDCLFQAGAQKVYGIDVGYGQVAWSIRQDPRLVLRERTNFRHLNPEDLYQAGDPRPTLGVMDLSFISLTKVLPTLWSLLAEPKEVILLVKPQFEVGRAQVGKNGVVRDPDAQAGAILSVLESAQALGWLAQGLTYSPITGPAGNIEYLLWLSMAEPQVSVDQGTIQQLAQSALTALKKPDSSDLVTPQSGNSV
ncbi:TlyA family RNA methyltransferase [Picosynechococcus sp. NKBG15041c]|uniref:TlyA family RNA methyltransferase n=1 Tax=Picosynechococcus sp. NKBG15041c TaxID=1407650 RepID=UPI00040DB677|nr:TlyA family RNA methyltransferase [Picosynechococcus sp. NKBG15041c]